MQEELTSEQRLYLSIRKRNKSVADDISRARKTTVRGELSDLGSVYFYLYLAICSPPEDAYLQGEGCLLFGLLPDLETRCP